MAEVTPPPIEEQPEVPVVDAPVEAPLVETPPTETPPAEPTSEQEWEAAESEVFEKLAGEDKKEEPATPTPPAEETPVTPDVPAAPPTEEPKKTETPAEDLEAVAQRVMSRNSQVAVEAAKSEIKAKIMPELPELKANDGFVIKSAKDLETVEDPRTPGKPFTTEEAERIFNEHKQGLQKIESETDARATRIATVNQALMDEATLALAAFKDVFAQHPELQKSMYDAYSKTLKMSPEGFIEEAPVGLLEFYNSALSPYTKSLAETPPTPAPPAPPVDNTKRNQDRSDIYKPSSQVLSEEDKEWAQAEEKVLGGN